MSAVERRQIQFSTFSINANSHLCLIDGGSNNGLAGNGMRLLEADISGERVDIIGATNAVDLQDLPLGTFCSVLTSSKGVRVLGIFPHMVGYGKGKSILSKIQAETYAHQIYDKPRQCGGMQKIVTPDGFVFKLKHIKGLLYLPMEYPTDNDLDSLPYIDLNDNEDDEVWFEVPDEEELDDKQFYDSRDGYYL